MDVRLSEVIGALSHALDITEGQPRGHAERSCLIGMRLAEMLGLPAGERSSLFYALLLKDAGCSSNAAKVAELYGADDAEVKRDRKTTDHLQPAQSLKHLWRATSPGRPLQKASRLRALVQHGSGGSRALTALRCERGARIARLAGLDDVTATAIRHLDEHWDGAGYPDGLAGEAISLGGRILCLAQTMEVFWQGGGPRAALDVAAERRGTWFDPALADLAARLEGDDGFWAELAAGEVGGTSRPTGSSWPGTTTSTASPRRSPRWSTPSPPTPAITRWASPRSPTGWPRRSGSTTRSAATCAAQPCCTTSASSASPTAFSTSPARSTTTSGGRCAATPT